MMFYSVYGCGQAQQPATAGGHTEAVRPAFHPVMSPTLDCGAFRSRVAAESLERWQS